MYQGVKNRRPFRGALTLWCGTRTTSRTRSAAPLRDAQNISPCGETYPPGMKGKKHARVTPNSSRKVNIFRIARKLWDPRRQRLRRNRPKHFFACGGIEPFLFSPTRTAKTKPHSFIRLRRKKVRHTKRVAQTCRAASRTTPTALGED